MLNDVMKISRGVSLKSYNTFAIDVCCDRLVEVEHEEEIPDLFKEDNPFGYEYFVMGDGSNVLFTNSFHGVVVKMLTKGIEKVVENEDTVWLRVAAGEKWEDFVNYCIENQYYGVENLIGIPGLVGSAPVQNIGAYSAEVKDVIDAVFGWQISTKLPFILTNSECQFAYRGSIFKTEMKGDCLITSVVFKLSKKEKYNITYQGLIDELKKSDAPLSLRRVADAVVAVRNSKLPDVRQYGCAGSFFKNPIVSQDFAERLRKTYPQLVSYAAGLAKVKLAAGQLIDLAGMKGVREGNVGVWPRQALVIVNYGNATGDEVVAFYKKIQQKVKEKFDILLDPEVNII